MYEYADITYPGSRGNLILSLYAPNSPFDNAITEWRRGVPLTCQARDWEVEDIVTGASGSINAGACTDTERNFWDSLSDITQLLTQNLNVGVGKPSTENEVDGFPKEGETCSGPVDGCATESAKRCLANPLSDSGAKHFSATCKASHFSVDQNGTGSILTQGEDLFSESNSSAFPLMVNNTGASLDLAQAVPAICPCNCTYISQACCGAADGVVYESGMLKLGELAPEVCRLASVASS